MALCGWLGKLEIYVERNSLPRALSPLTSVLALRAGSVDRLIARIDSLAEMERKDDGSLQNRPSQVKTCT
jgi:hypothetical protein